MQEVPEVTEDSILAPLDRCKVRSALITVILKGVLVPYYCFGRETFIMKSNDYDNVYSIILDIRDDRFSPLHASRLKTKGYISILFNSIGLRFPLGRNVLLNVDTKTSFRFVV